KPLIGADLIEVWHASGPVNIGFDGIVRYAADADHMLGAIELDERDYGGIAGAAAGLRALDPMRDERFPAATCIGRRDGDPMVQVYWLAGRAPGVPLENPRQVSAYRY